MAMRRKKLWKPDADGYYSRQLGWKLSPTGKRVQHTFRLGTEQRDAELRELKLRTLWERVERGCAPAAALWSDTTLELGKAIARGDAFALLPKLAGEPEEAYALRVRRAHQEQTAIRACPADEAAFAPGSGVAMMTLTTGVMFPPSPAEAYLRSLEASFVPTPPPMLEFARREPAPQVVHGSPRAGSAKSEAPVAGTLHEAMNAYVAWIEQEYFDEGLGRLTDNGRTKVREVRTLQGRHGDVPLAGLGFEEVRTMFGYWRRRPRKKTKTGPGSRITVKSAQNDIGELKRFFAWLHTSQQFAWRRPEDFYETAKTTSS
jgi:hypothetical protein